MPNPNPVKARLEKKRRLRTAGDLKQTRRAQWQAVVEGQHVMLYADNDETKLRGVHAVSQAVSVYIRLLEIGEFEARLKALEDAQMRRNGQ